MCLQLIVIYCHFIFYNPKIINGLSHGTVNFRTECSLLCKHIEGRNTAEFDYLLSFIQNRICVNNVVYQHSFQAFSQSRSQTSDVTAEMCKLVMLGFCASS